MGASSQDYIDFVTGQLAELPGLAHGRFFGGVGLTAHGVQFAMLMDNALYFVVDDQTRPRYQAWGSDCFRYQTHRGPVDVKKYYEVPGELLDDPAALLPLAEEAVGVASRLKQPSPRRSRKTQ